jgi:hypothetical protein
MKTSKVIFISLLSLIGLYIVAAMIEVKITGRKTGKFDTTLKVKKLALPAFTAIYLADSKNLTVIESDSAFLEVLVLKASQFPDINCIITGDTLQIRGFQKSNSDRVFVTLHIATNLSTIKLVNSEIVISNFNSKNVSFDLDQSKVSVAINKSRPSIFGTMNITAKNNSAFTANSLAIDTLGVKLQNSEANLSVSIRILTCDLKYNSKFFTKQPMEISLKRDASSTFSFFGQ